MPAQLQPQARIETVANRCLLGGVCPRATAFPERTRYEAPAPVTPHQAMLNRQAPTAVLFPLLPVRGNPSSDPSIKALPFPGHGSRPSCRFGDALHINSCAHGIVLPCILCWCTFSLPGTRPQAALCKEAVPSSRGVARSCRLGFPWK